MIVMLLTSFCCRDMRDKFVWFCMEVRSRVAVSIFIRFRRSRDLVYIQAECRALLSARLLGGVIYFMFDVSLADCMNSRLHVGRNRSCSVSVVNKKKCKLTNQIKNLFFQDPLMLVNLFGLILKLLIFPGFRYVHFPISNCNHSIKQDQKIVSFLIIICFLHDEVHFIGALCI